MKLVLRRLGLVLLGLLLALVALEVFVRVFDPLGASHFRDMQRYLVEFCEHPGPPRILRQPANRVMAFRDFTIRTNRLGLRGPEIAAKKSAGEYRILFLGDSVVLGWGAREEDLFLTRAEAELDALAPAGVHYRCVNAGHNQYDTVQEAATLAEIGDRVAPDAVLLVYVANDVEPTIRVWKAYREQAALAAAHPPGPWPRFVTWLRSGPLAGLEGIRLYFQYAGAPAAAAAGAAPATDAEGWQRSRDALARIRDWCRARGVPFLLLDHSHPGTETQGPEVPELIPFLQEAAIRRFPFHFTIEERAQPIRHSATDAHANRLGHTILLGKLRPALRALGLKTR